MTPGDLPKAELMDMADEAVVSYRKLGLKANVFFKATCPKCGERPIFTEPNVVYDEMECSGCGTIFPFTHGGFLMEITRDAK